MFGNPVKKIEKLTEKKNTEKLAAFTEHKKKPVRIAAIDGLGKCDRCDEAYNALVTCVHDADAEIRAHAILALGTLGDMKARAHIEHQLSRETDASCKEAAAKALKMLHGRED